MKILLKLPNWLGDGVMATPSIEILKSHFCDAEFSIVAPYVVCELFKKDSRITRIYVDTTKKATNRFKATLTLAKEIGFHDIAISFTNHFYSALLLYATKSKIRIGYGGLAQSLMLTAPLKRAKHLHQVLSYAHLLSPIIDMQNLKVPHLHISGVMPKSHIPKDSPMRIGLNPGGAYGSAKRWLPEYFAKVASYFLAQGHSIVVFGGEADKDIATEIQNEAFGILKSQISQYQKNFIDLSGKTSIQELIYEIANLDIFITNDSGPMHIATATKTPTIALFGPTDSSETSPWHFTQIKLLSEHLSCSPCKKRECPLQHHNCMKLLTPQKVIDSSIALLSESERKDTQ